MPLSWQRNRQVTGDSALINVSHLDSGPCIEKNCQCPCTDEKCLTTNIQTQPQPYPKPQLPLTETTYRTLGNDSALHDTESEIYGHVNNLRQFASSGGTASDDHDQTDTHQAEVHTVRPYKSPYLDGKKVILAATPSSSSVKSPTTAFDKLAFKAVASACDDLQKKGILVISDNSPVDAVHAPLHLNTNVARFFMTDQQTDNFSSSEPESWPKVPHSEALRQNYHPRLGVAPQLARVNGTDLGPALVVGTTGEKIPLFDVAHFVGNIPFPRGPYFTEDFSPPGIALNLACKNTSQDNKVLTMLKFIVKYTDIDINGSWIRRFLNKPLVEEVNELRVFYDALQISQKMEKHWQNLQKERYSEHHRWLHRLAPINAQVWAAKQLYKISQPNRYLRKKAMWHSVCRKPFANPQTMIIPHGDIAPVKAAVSEVTQATQVAPSTANVDAPDDAFQEWVKNSGANLSVTISYAWNELAEEGALKTPSPEPYQFELMEALRGLEAGIKSYGTDGHRIEQTDAVLYAGVILRFTQALHDYLEVKDGLKEMSGTLGGWNSEREPCYDDLVVATGAVPDDGCACYKCRVSWSDGMEECPCAYCVSTETKEEKKERKKALELSENVTITSESEYEKTKRLLKYLDQVTDDNSKAKGLGIVNENVGVLPEDVRVRLLRSDRLRYYETRNHFSEVGQTESMVTNPDLSADSYAHSSLSVHDGLPMTREQQIPAAKNREDRQATGLKYDGKTQYGLQPHEGQTNMDH